ncbi:DUF2007 domain-containing protein [Nibribacter koreensis]|uniref:DUF2007 domain-containing protein n=1 Tax=Nibribacter koreensis TaxID=1084519 RepID=A0ABP8FGI4_9BACT
MKDELVTVSTYSSAIDAHLAKNKLESEGILAFLFDENMVSLNPLYNISIGGIKLKTLESDRAQAEAVLSSLQDQPYTNEQNEVITCPQCGSENISYAYDSSNRLKSFMGFLLALVTFSLPLLSKDRYTCNQCHHVFQK